jgi:NAD(P)-dependent dehydrogenase (short-subunit alcohol dehydrogenase family)
VRGPILPRRNGEVALRACSRTRSYYDAAVRDLVATAVQIYGRLDCAVNNAGAEATGLIADSFRDALR